MPRKLYPVGKHVTVIWPQRLRGQQNVVGEQTLDDRQSFALAGQAEPVCSVCSATMAARAKMSVSTALCAWLVLLCYTECVLGQPPCSLDNVTVQAEFDINKVS